MADCAIFVLWDTERRLALMEDRPDLKPGSEHYWVFPGGKVEPGETSQWAMQRECREEVGVLPTTFRKLPGEMRSRPIPGTRSFRAGHEGWRSIPYLVTQWNGDVPSATLDDNHAPLAWRDVTALAGPPDGYSCNAEIATAVLAAAQQPPPAPAADPAAPSAPETVAVVRTSPCPECGAARRWAYTPVGGWDAVCDQCGRRGAHDDPPAPPSAPDAGTTRAQALHEWFHGLRSGTPAGPDVGVAFRAGWDAATAEVQRQHTAALAERDADLERLRAILADLTGPGSVRVVTLDGEYTNLLVRVETLDRARDALAAAPQPPRGERPLSEPQEPAR